MKKRVLKTRRKRKKPLNKIVKIYDTLLQIQAIKTRGDYSGRYYHNFKQSAKAEIFGLPDGSILIKSKTGIRLWDTDERKHLYK